jgi:hypothetical protein
VIPRARTLLAAWLALCCAVAAPAPSWSQDDEDEEEDLRDRLTEREDKRRPLEPFGVPLFGHELVLGGEYEMEVGWVRPRVLEPEVDGRIVREPDQLAMSHELQLEAFYSIGDPLSLFVQFQGIWDEDLLGRTFESVSDTYLERGEMWLYSEDVLGSGLSVDVGRLDFEDDRRWWWDDELDAARVIWEAGDVEVQLALAYEIASSRSDQSFVEPEQERVLRWIGEASWDLAEAHSLQLFLLHQDDHSPREGVGQSVPAEREDDSDARLSWLGGRATGLADLAASGFVGYWLDAALVRGKEREIDFGDVMDGRVVAGEVARHDVSGWALDVGVDWLLPLSFEPRLFAGYAYGSGDATSGGDDRAFRQSDLQANEAGFGGVERFNSYGLLLQPELSNLGIVTVGAGLALFRSSSLDLVYHHYRLAEPAEDLRDSLLQAQLDGQHRELGHGIDLVLALEEWERFELDVALAALRTSNAFGIGDNEPPGDPDPEEVGGRRWIVGAFLAVRYAF